MLLSVSDKQPSQPSASAQYTVNDIASSSKNGVGISDTEQSDDDDAEERLDCVHDIHSQRQRQQGRTSLLKHQQLNSNYDEEQEQYSDACEEEEADEI